MNKAVRKAVIAGNWKMNKTPAEATELLNAITPLVKDAGCDGVACVPYVDIAAALEATKGTNGKIGAENCHWAKSGAFKMCIRDRSASFPTGSAGSARAPVRTG